MSQCIHFMTSMFDVSQEQVNPINPIYGSSLLQWLRKELQGKIAITEPAAEDWGWYSELAFEGNSYLIGASACVDEGDNPQAELEWVFQVERSRSLKEKLLGRNKMTQQDPCFVLFRTLFAHHESFKDVQVA